VSPQGIKEDVVIAFHLNRDASVKTVTYTGLKNQDQIRVFTGPRDDPFIFHRFFRNNVISMVLSIPMSSFPPGQQDFLLWGTVFKGTTQIDHVGRSSRSQQARFEGLNTLHPSQHVASLMKRMAFWDRLGKRLRDHTRSTAVLDISTSGLAAPRRVRLCCGPIDIGAHLNETDGRNLPVRSDS